MRRILPLAPVLLFALIAIPLGLSLRLEPRKILSTLIDRPLPAFTLASLEGASAGLSSQDVQGKVALLNIFASWCGYCRAEHATLMTLAQDGGVPIYGINWKDRPGDGARWLKQNRNPYVRVGDDRAGQVGIDLGVTGVPETFVIDRGGRIRYRHAGPITNEVWHDTFMPLLNELAQR
jgi:cytochrome c biogenesis protein CcmG, thiol:disulfide interchange protein DsbE